MHVAVLGGTGLIGAPIVEALTDAGHSVRVVSRDANRALRQFGPSMEVAEADAETGLGLEHALEGCEGAVLSIASPREGECVSNVIDAARLRRSVGHVVYVSGCSVMPENAWFPMIAGKLAAEQALRSSGLPWTVLAPGWFFDTLTRFVRNGRAVLFGDDPTAYHFMAASDFAEVVVKSFELPEARDRRFVIHGPEGITLKNALTRYCAIRHPEIRAVSQPPLWLLRGMARFKRNHQLASALDLMAYFRKVGEPGDPREAQELFGTPTTTLEVWAASD